PQWQYCVQLGFANGDTEPDLRLPLRDAYLTWSGLRDLNVRFGQGKVPFNRQRVVSSSALQFVDRSRSNAEFNLDRDVGLQLLSQDLLGLGGRLGYSLGIFGGDGRNRTGPANDGVLAVARLQWSPFGGFDDLIEADIAREAQPRLAFQVAGAFNRSTSRSRSTFDSTYVLGPYDYAHANADALFKWRGLSFHGEFIYREAVGTRRRVGADGKAELSRSGWGYHAQLGYMLGEHLEVVGRVGEVVPLGQLTGVKRSGEYGGGLNWYFQEHAFKIQADAFWLTGATFQDGHPQVRMQAQFYL
ncbi:MAG: porin, partial [Deltaproteobacteria bacterium]|nr:porin [Deltaproteobacteria bacterium]